MAKAIIKLNVYLPSKQLADFIEMVNKQLKNDIIYVPYYCDVYVVDGNTEIKVENPKTEKTSDVIRTSCETCKYEKYDKAFMKCVACDIYSNWEAKEEPIKSCTNCKYHVNKNGIYDCTCFDGVCGPDNKNWEAKENEH